MSMSSPARISLIVSVAAIVSGLCFLTGCDHEHEDVHETASTHDAEVQQVVPDTSESETIAEAEPPPSKPGLAVLPFNHKGDVGEADAGEILADLLLHKAIPDNFELYRAYQLQAILQELDLQTSTLANNMDTAVKIGQHSGVRYLVSGDLSRLGTVYYLSARVVDCETGQVTSTGSVNFTSFDDIALDLQELASQLELKDPDAELMPEPSTSTVDASQSPAEKIEQLYLDGSLAAELTYAGLKLFEADPESLNESDTKRLNYFNQLLSGELTADKLQRGLDLVDASEQLHINQMQQQIETEKQAKITALLQIAKDNDNKQNSPAALDALDELLALDPNHTEAQLLRADIGLYNSPTKVGDTWTNSIGMTFAYIPRGSFLMGSSLDPDELSEKLEYDPEPFIKHEFPHHKVTLTKPFCLGTTEVTVEQFAQFVKETGYRTTAEVKGHSKTINTSGWANQRSATWRKPYIEQGSEYPVLHVSWHDATAFCAWLNKREGRQYRLPTEAEWEYACRAGSTTSWSWGDKVEDGNNYANMADKLTNQWMEQLGQTYNNLEAKWDDGFTHTAPVGSFKPNAWGLYDMHGNIYEWCLDVYGAYSKQAQIDPQGPRSGDKRVLRGGTWCTTPWRCRTTRRHEILSNYSAFHIGFRIAVDLDTVR